jgi:hypothetical protein
VTENPAANADDPVIKIANEFTEVEVGRVRTRNGVRLRIFVPSSGRQILLCPLELEALTWQDHELFSHLLATPGDPAEAQADPAQAPDDPAEDPGGTHAGAPGTEPGAAG